MALARVFLLLRFSLCIIALAQLSWRPWTNTNRIGNFELRHLFSPAVFSLVCTINCSFFAHSTHERFTICAALSHLRVRRTLETSWQLSRSLTKLCLQNHQSKRWRTGEKKSRRLFTRRMLSQMSWRCLKTKLGWSGHITLQVITNRVPMYMYARMNEQRSVQARPSPGQRIDY